MSVCQIRFGSLNTPEIFSSVESPGGIEVWRFPHEFSQSKLCGRRRSSNACTIISLKIAEALHSLPSIFPYPSSEFTARSYMGELLHRQCVSLRQRNRLIDLKDPVEFVQLRNFGSCPDVSVTIRNTAGNLSSTNQQPSFPPDQWSATTDPRRIRPLDPLLCSVLANSILDGNEIHAEAMKKRRDSNRLNFTIPDALEAIHSYHHNVRLQEMDFIFVPVRELAFQIYSAIEFWERNKSTLTPDCDYLPFVIIAFERSVLLVYQSSAQTLTLIDSHCHNAYQGAVIACTSSDNIANFCDWMCFHIFPESLNLGGAVKNHDNQFEISAHRYLRRPSRAISFLRRIFLSPIKPMKRPFADDGKENRPPKFRKIFTAQSRT